MIDESIPVGLYLCQTPKGERVCRYGYHRRNNDKLFAKPENWTPPMEASPVKLIWLGWRDDQSLNFYRPEEIKNIGPRVDVLAGTDTSGDLGVGD